MDPIYILRERPKDATSRDAGRYIGVTTELPLERLRQHLTETKTKKRTHKLNWLRSLEEVPVVEVIEWVLPMHREEREKYWIALFRAYGHKLTNSTDGGEGVLGLRTKSTPEHRAKISAALKGVPKTPEHAAAAGRARRGVKTEGSSSQYLGVSRYRNKWMAYYKPYKKSQINLGYYLEEKDAALARDAFIMQRQLDPRFLNFPPAIS